MAPLDFGSTNVVHLVDPLRTPAPEAYDTLGAYFRSVRERRGDSRDELAKLTRIRGQYLESIENGDRSGLPSRPFAIGYVRAYARALGLDPETAVARYKSEWPESEPGLRNPIGMGDQADPRRPIIYAAIAVVLGAVTLWNVAQRTLTGDDPTPPTLSLAAAAPAPTAPTGPVKLADATPAPAESSLPKPYVTPGLDPAADAEAAKAQAAAATKATVAPSAGPAGLETRRPVLGAATGPVVLQARDAAVSLVVRRTDNTIVFAHVMQPQEAFRVAADASLTAEASDPQALDAYVNGKLVGKLVQPSTPLAVLATLAPTPAATPAPAASPATAAPKAAPKA